jgi:hypothetical protein
MFAVRVYTGRMNVRVLTARMNAGFFHIRCDCMQEAQAAQGAGRAGRRKIEV